MVEPLEARNGIEPRPIHYEVSGTECCADQGLCRSALSENAIVIC